MLSHMTRSRFHVFLDDAQRQALGAIKARDGIPESEQVRRAVDAWIYTKDVYDVVGAKATKRKFDVKVDPRRKKARAK
jgi:hypothetical protein